MNSSTNDFGILNAETTSVKAAQTGSHLRKFTSLHNLSGFALVVAYKSSVTGGRLFIYLFFKFHDNSNNYCNMIVCCKVHKLLRIVRST